MRTHPNNPPENCLPNGITPEILKDAVRASGYPLQILVAKKLVESRLAVVEEWGYSDRHSGEHRTLDVFAHQEIGTGSPHLTPSLNLLIECKRSELPFVFFTPSVSRLPPDFPVISGVPTSYSLRVPGKGSRVVSPATFLQAADLPFVSTSVPIVSAFARSERKGKALELSGTAGFQGLVLPLCSALDHFTEMWRIENRSQSYAPQVALSIGIVDAPMVVVGGTPEEPILTLEPWVRVVRQEPSKSHRQWSRKHYVVDVVHRAFVTDYVEGHAVPFGAALAARMHGKENLFVQARGHVPSVHDWTWDSLSG